MLPVDRVRLEMHIRPGHVYGFLLAKVVPRQNTDLPLNQVYRSGAHFGLLTM
jgi:hypothetical protein